MSATQMLAGELSFRTASERWQPLLQQAGAEVSCYDLSQLGRCDSAGLAALVELKARAAARGVALSFCNVPARLLQLARVSGVESLFNPEQA